MHINAVQDQGITPLDKMPDSMYGNGDRHWQPDDISVQHTALLKSPQI